MFLAMECVLTAFIADRIDIITLIHESMEGRCIAAVIAGITLLVVSTVATERRL